ncbi:MAG: endonuclease domain-containing protein [Sphingomonas sp.]|uniref:endonuclease domain-containing protein n=1 Tax=Sphingomonas sp. TaxID=28214 RepID=UPI001AC65D2E|nr:DUF559 domain-containing protein [Sphingomonas sp.]MBN8808790.1 endonuclease domain-containing protein [Sphingomonas sp.]
MPEWRQRDTIRARQLRNEATAPERTLWRYLSASQLGHKFSRQIPIGPYFGDFVCRRAKLVVELDGQSHDCSIAADARRDAFLRSEGFEVLRFTNDEVMANAEGVVHAISAALADTPTPNPVPGRPCPRQGLDSMGCCRPGTRKREGRV